MIKKEIEIVVETGDAKKDVNDLGNSFENLSKKAKDLEEQIKQTLDPDKKNFLKKQLQDVNSELGKTDKAAEGAGKSAKGASIGIKAIGLGLKALGIGAVTAAIAFFADALSRNQKFTDALSTALETIALVFTQVVNAIVKTVEQVNASSAGFDSLGKVIKGLLTLAFTPLKLAFFSITLAVQEAQLAFEKSFFGDKDPKTINDLNERIDKTRLNILEVGADAVKAGKDVATNVAGAIGELSSAAAIATDNLGKISVKSAFEQAQVTNQLKNTAELAEASIQGLIEKYDQEAELLRQIRDDDRLSIEQRIKANNDLGLKLDEQAKAQKDLANVGLQLARQNLKGNEDNQAFRKAEILALNEIAAIEATVTGFRAEQLTNRNALDKERIELLRELNEIGKTDVELAKSEAEQLRDDRLIQISLQVEDTKEKFRLLAEAQKDFNATITEIDETEKERLDKIEIEKNKKDIDSFNLKIENESLSFENRLDIIKQQEEAINNSIFASDDERTKALKANSDARTNIEKLEADSKAMLLSSVSSSLQQAGKIAGEETEAGKALAVASALINTYQGISAGVKLGFPAAIPAVLAAATVGFKSVKDIIAVKTPMGGGSSVGGSAASAAGGGRQSSPAFNLTGRSNVNQLQTGIDQQETAPVRAFVVSQDVTNQQAADRATRSQASFG